MNFFFQVTFDQQLYAKAVPMVLAAPPDSPLKRVIFTLGGFHFLKSVLGAVGTIMAGSGLGDCLEVVYAKNTVKHMLSGDAYARAIRGHFLVHLALLTHLFESSSEELKNDLQLLFTSALNGEVSIDELQTQNSVQTAIATIQQSLDDASMRSRTCKLWAQYLDIVNLIQMFIRAERSGDWNLHLVTIRKLIPFFHAASTTQNQLRFIFNKWKTST